MMQGHAYVPSTDQRKRQTYLGHQLAVLIEMHGLQPAIVEQLSLIPRRPPSIENFGRTGGEHRPRERIGERA